MKTDANTPSEESRLRFMELREEALANRLFLFPAYKETDKSLIREWKMAGWIASTKSGPGFHSVGDWYLVDKFWAYGPGEPRIMEVEEYETYLEAARLSLGPYGIIQVLEFERLTPREGLYRLEEAGFVTIRKQGHSRTKKFVLDKACREG